MGRVKAETLVEIQAYLDALPSELKGKCALCNETLTHIVKAAEAKTGAGTATICRTLSDEINEGAADGDRVSDSALRGRVRDHEGTKRGNWPNGPDNQPTDSSVPSEKSEQPTYEQLKKSSQSNGALYFADLAILQLKRITDDDRTAREALGNIIEWCHKKLNKLEG